MTILGQIHASDELAKHATPVGIAFPHGGDGTAGTDGAVPNKPGYLYARGQLLSSATYPKLDALFGAAAPQPHLHNGGVSPGAGQFRLPNFQRAMAVHKVAGSGTASALGTAIGGSPKYGAWAHNHTVGSLAMNDHQHGIGSLRSPNHTHPHNLYIGDHTHSYTSSTTPTTTGAGQGLIVNYIDQTTQGSSLGNVSISGGIGSDGDVALAGGNTGSADRGLGLTGSVTSVTNGVGAPYLFLNFIIFHGDV